MQMYENIIDWVALSEVIGVIPSALLKMAFIWGVPLLILLGLYLIYTLGRGIVNEKRLQKHIQNSKVYRRTRHNERKHNVGRIL